MNNGDFWPSAEVTEESEGRWCRTTVSILPTRYPPRRQLCRDILYFSIINLSLTEWCNGNKYVHNLSEKQMLKKYIFSYLATAIWNKTKCYLAQEREDWRLCSFTTLKILRKIILLFCVMSLFVDKDIFTSCDAKLTLDQHQVTINCIFPITVHSFIVKKNTSKFLLLQWTW